MVLVIQAFSRPSRGLIQAKVCTITEESGSSCAIPSTWRATATATILWRGSSVRPSVSMMSAAAMASGCCFYSSFNVELLLCSKSRGDVSHSGLSNHGIVLDAADVKEYWNPTVLV